MQNGQQHCQDISPSQLNGYKFSFNRNNPYVDCFQQQFSLEQRQKQAISREQLFQDNQPNCHIKQTKLNLLKLKHTNNKQKNNANVKARVNTENTNSYIRINDNTNNEDPILLNSSRSMFDTSQPTNNKNMNSRSNENCGRSEKNKMLIDLYLRSTKLNYKINKPKSKIIKTQININQNNSNSQLKKQQQYQKCNTTRVHYQHQFKPQQKQQEQKLNQIPEGCHSQTNITERKNIKHPILVNTNTKRRIKTQTNLQNVEQVKMNKDHDQKRCFNKKKLKQFQIINVRNKDGEISDEEKIDNRKDNGIEQDIKNNKQQQKLTQIKKYFINNKNVLILDKLKRNYSYNKFSVYLTSPRQYIKVKPISSGTAPIGKPSTFNTSIESFFLSNIKGKRAAVHQKVHESNTKHIHSNENKHKPMNQKFLQHSQQSTKDHNQSTIKPRKKLFSFKVKTEGNSDIQSQPTLIDESINHIQQTNIK